MVIDVKVDIKGICIIDVMSKVVDDHDCSYVGSTKWMNPKVVPLWNKPSREYAIG